MFGGYLWHLGVLAPKSPPLSSPLVFRHVRHRQGRKGVEIQARFVQRLHTKGFCHVLRFNVYVVFT